MGNNIARNIELYEKRERPERLTKYKIEIKNHLSREKTKKEIDYKYYICDYCEKEIKLLKNEKGIDGNMVANGGIVQLPISLTNAKKVITLALCNKCLKPVIQQFEQEKLEKDNYNHIPRIN